MEFVINNPNVPQNMFQHQPNNMPTHQNQQYIFNNFNNKKVVLFYTNASYAAAGRPVSPPSAPADFGYIYNRIYTSPTNIITYDNEGHPHVPKASKSGSFTTAVYNSDGTFKFTLIEPLQIDKISDVFLDNMTFANASFNAYNSPESYGVVLQINELQQNIVSNNSLINNRELIVVNSTSNPDDSTTHNRPVYYESKNKKYNFLGIISPGRYKEINGRLCDLNGSGILELGGTSPPLAQNLCFSIELIISNQ